jgi:diacylglycerol diphosphate phosphatase/phosphatidate phosphatase
MSFVLDWLVTAVVAVGYVGLEFPTPFMREFTLDNESIQHPFAEHERVPDWLCIVCY